MSQLPPMTVRQLIDRLQQCDPEALVIGTLFNGWTDTYCALDHVSEFTFDQLFNDYFGTPGATDDRVWHTNAKNVVCIDSLFSYDKIVSRDIRQNLKDDLDYWHQKV